MSSRELDILSRSLKGDYTVLRSDFLAEDPLKDVSDTAKEEKARFVTLVAVLRG